MALKKQSSDAADAVLKKKSTPTSKTTSKSPSKSISKPTLRLEKNLLKKHESLVALDEVGRGSAAGPVAVGAVLLNPSLSKPPSGLNDSKKLSPLVRENLVSQIRSWCPSSVGYASCEEVDEWGMTTALTIAARRALDLLNPNPGIVLLDGSYDWINNDSLLKPGFLYDLPKLEVITIVKGDAKCLSIAAASIVAKVERDSLMQELSKDFPNYGWDSNKGYLSQKHLAALREFGFSKHHRMSWDYPLD